MEKLLNVAEVAKELGLNPQTLYRMVREKKIPHIRLTQGTIRFVRTEIDKWFNSKRVKVKWERNIKL